MMLPAGTDVTSIVHCEPWRDSASGRDRPDESSPYPTATHRVAELQETPRSAATFALGGLTGCWATQVIPFHSAAHVRWAKDLVVSDPTAVQVAAEGHETARR